MSNGTTDRRATRRLVKVATYGEIVEVVNDRRMNHRRTSDGYQAVTGQPGSRPGRRASDRQVVAPTRSVSW